MGAIGLVVRRLAVVLALTLSGCVALVLTTQARAGACPEPAKHTLLLSSYDTQYNFELYMSGEWYRCDAGAEATYMSVTLTKILSGFYGPAPSSNDMVLVRSISYECHIGSDNGAITTMSGTISRTTNFRGKAVPQTGTIPYTKHPRLTCSAKADIAYHTDESGKDTIYAL